MKTQLIRIVNRKDFTRKKIKSIRVIRKIPVEISYLENKKIVDNVYCYMINSKCYYVNQVGHNLISSNSAYENLNGFIWKDIIDKNIFLLFEPNLSVELYSTLEDTFIYDIKNILLK